MLTSADGLCSSLKYGFLFSLQGIQYWINAICPAGQSWNQIALYGGTYCWKNNSGGSVTVPNQPITNIANLDFQQPGELDGGRRRAPTLSTVAALNRA